MRQRKNNERPSRSCDPTQPTLKTATGPSPPQDIATKPARINHTTHSTKRQANPGALLIHVARAGFSLSLVLVLAQLFPEPLREEPAGVHAEIDGRGQRHEHRDVAHARHVLHADLHGGPARAPLALDRGAHDEAAGERPRSARGRLGERGRVDDELPAALGADGRLGDGDGALVGARVEDQLQAVAERVDGAALAPGLQPRPRLPAGRPRARGLEDEPGARVGAGDAAGARGRHERRHHRRRRHGGPRQVVDRHRPALPLLASRVRAVAAFAVEGAAQPGPQPAAGAPAHGRLRRQRSGQKFQARMQRLVYVNVTCRRMVALLVNPVKCGTDILAWCQVCMRQD
jgi:hypothetical protein